MTWRIAALPLVLLLPGYFTLHLPLWGKTNRAKTAFGQRLFLSLLISVLIAGPIGLALAQAGAFSLGSLSLALAAYVVFCLAFIAIKGDGLALRPPSLRFDWEDAIVIFLFCLSLLLYARPSEYILGWLDAGWYVNTGVHVAKTGSLSGESQILASLPSEAKPLFYSSFASLKKLFPYFPDTESRGIYLWSFAVADPEGGQVTAYHPPLFSIWIAIFYALGGLRFALYATPFLGAMSVLSLYFAGKAMFDRKVGLLAAVLLAIGFTQIYFSRTPYSEVLSQLLLFSGIYAFTTYVVERQRLYAVIAALSLGQAVLSRIEGLVVILPLALFLGCWVVLKRSLPKDFRFFAIPFGLLLADGAVLAGTVSRPYVELNAYGLWVKLRPLLATSAIWLVTAAILAGGSFVLLVYWGLSGSLGERSANRLSRIHEGRHLISTLFSLALLLLAVYAYFIYKDENLVQLGKFMSPLGLWLGVFGLVELIRRGVSEKTAFFLTLALIHGLASLSVLAISTTRSYVYPIRRQVPMVIPALTLLASYALWMGSKDLILRPLGSPSRDGKLLRGVQLATVAILLVSSLLAQATLSIPYVNHREMQGAIAFAERLADHFGEQDVVLFEETWFQDSRVGHFAAPLWTIHDQDTLLMSTANADVYSNPADAAFPTAADQWLDSGKSVYFVSQWDPPPLPLKEHKLLPVAEERWRYSTLTGKLVFPPEIREFETPFYIYQLTVEGESYD